MYSKFRLAYNYLHYFLTASSGKGHGIHSPFVFDFITQVLNDQATHPEYDTVEALRHRLCHDKRILSVQDAGAGSRLGHTGRRSVASIARHASKPKKFGQLFFRMVRKYKPQTILELGTSLGITSSYLAMADNKAKLFTLEGASEIASMAEANFSSLQLKNSQLIRGNFDQTLKKTLSAIPSPDFVFVDGNHRQEPTERYFKQLLAHAGPNTIFVFDDIHWSSGMEKAWKTIREAPETRCTIDLFFIGIVLFRPEFHEKQHFSIRF